MLKITHFHYRLLVIFSVISQISNILKKKRSMSIEPIPKTRNLFDSFWFLLIRIKEIPSLAYSDFKGVSIKKIMYNITKQKAHIPTTVEIKEHPPRLIFHFIDVNKFSLNFFIASLIRFLVIHCKMFLFYIARALTKPYFVNFNCYIRLHLKAFIKNNQASPLNSCNFEFIVFDFFNKILSGKDKSEENLEVQLFIANLKSNWIFSSIFN
jgi:hypothetical protein